MAAERVWRTYTTDQGDLVLVQIFAWVTTLPGHGFGAYDATKPTKPRQVQMRYITLTSTTTSRHRKLHAGTSTGTMYSTLGTNYTLSDADGGSETYTSTGRVGEKLRKGPHA
jgi:hypothetical protein